MDASLQALQEFLSWRGALLPSQARNVGLYGRDLPGRPGKEVRVEEAVRAFLRRHPEHTRWRHDLVKDAGGRTSGIVLMDEEKWDAERAGPGGIRELRIETFKSYDKAALKLFPLTLLIGPNASGKSNLVEALRVLSHLAKGNPLGSLSVPSAEGNGTIRGTVQDFPTDECDSFGFGCDLGVLNALPWTKFQLRIRAAASQVGIAEERLESFSGSGFLYRAPAREATAEEEILVEYNDFGYGGPEAGITCTDQRLVLTQLDTPAAFAKTHGESQRTIPLVTKALRNALSRMVFLEPAPRRMAGYVRLPANSLMDNGANLSGVLYTLCEKLGDKEAVLEFVRKLPEEEIGDITFIRTESDDVRVRVSETFGGHAHVRDAPALSDGTLRVLAVAAAVLSAPERSLVVIEEIDSGIHPSRATALLENIQRVAKKRHLSVLLTTHDPALADGLPTEAIPHVACCFRDPESGFSRLMHLQEFHRYPELIAQGSVGRLMTKGIIEKYLKDPRDPEQLKADALKWLEDWRERAK